MDGIKSSDWQALDPKKCDLALRGMISMLNSQLEVN
jgi:hypothetical protein